MLFLLSGNLLCHEKPTLDDPIPYLKNFRQLFSICQQKTLWCNSTLNGVYIFLHIQRIEDFFFIASFALLLGCMYKLLGIRFWSEANMFLPTYAYPPNQSWTIINKKNVDDTVRYFMFARNVIRKKFIVLTNAGKQDIMRDI
jgi:hypothetical protein